MTSYISDEQQAGDQRDRAATERDLAAGRRDDAGEERDRAAERRDQAAEVSESEAGGEDAVSRSALARQAAASDRERASQDRGSGAGDRDWAELDRESAQADRGASAAERAASSRDHLTGAYLRGPGLLMLDHEIARATRTEQPLVVGFVDIDHLKAINDSQGHSAGDRMLLQVADACRARLRSYDLVIRFGGDEFVCAVSGLGLIASAERFALVNDALAEAPEPGTVTFGLAELQPGDTLEDLVSRADSELYRKRRNAGGGGRA